MREFVQFCFVTLRVWKKHWTGVVLSLLGIAMAVAFSLMTFLYVWDAYNSDSWVPEVERVYRVGLKLSAGGGEQLQNGYSPITPSLLLEILKETFPEVEAGSRFYSPYQNLKIGDENVSRKLFFTDSNTAKLFPFKTVFGDLNFSLNNRQFLILTETKATNLFGEENPIGKSLTVTFMEKEFEFEVGAVIEDLPPNTHFKFEMLAKLNDEEFEQLNLRNGWENQQVFSYLLFKEGTNFELFNENFSENFTAKIPTESLYKNYTYILEPVYKMQWNGLAQFGFKTLANKNSLLSLGGVSLIMILAALLNHLNLTSAITGTRGRDIGVRKAFGASNKRLVFRYVSEGVFLALIGYSLGLLLTGLLAPYIETYIRTDVLIFSEERMPLIGAGALVMVLFGGLSAFFPSIFLVRRKTQDLLQSSQGSTTGGRGRVRQFLVLTQSALAIGGVAAGLIVFTQVNYIVNIDKGFTTKNMMYVIAPPYNFLKREESIENVNKWKRVYNPEAVKINGVLSGATQTSGPFGNTRSTQSFFHTKTNERTDFYFSPIESNYFDVIGVEPIISLPFKDFEDRPYVYINEKAVKTFGFESNEEALGETVYIYFRDGEKKDDSLNVIVGIVPDLKIHAGEEMTKAIVYDFTRKFPFGQSFLIQFETNDIQGLVSDLQSLWEEHFPEFPFVHGFWEDDILKAQERTLALADAVMIAAITTVLLGLAGLYGMATFYVNSRARELAIRKVLGATRAHILRRTLLEFLLPVLLGGLIVIPLVERIMDEWLLKYQFRIEPSWDFYAPIILGALVVSTIIISGQIMRALNIRPASVLHHE